MNEEEERHQNLHFQNLFIPESRKYYSAYNVIVLRPINGCLHEFLGFFFFILFFLTLGIVSASKICVYADYCAKCKNSRTRFYTMQFIAFIACIVL